VPKHALYSGPVFDMARRQFEDVADHLGISEDERDRLLPGVLPTARNQAAQLAQRAMDVTDGVGKRHDAQTGFSELK
jgi:hypothetical protein